MMYYSIRILVAASLFAMATSSVSIGEEGHEGNAFDRSVKFADNFEAVIPRPEQDQVTKEKLAALRQKTGRRPNILWLVVDDMGYGDPGCYGVEHLPVLRRRILTNLLRKD